MSDVAAHVVGSIADVVSGQLEGLGSPEATAREVAERKGRSPAELVQELAAVTKLAADLAAVFDDAAWEAPAPAGTTARSAKGSRRCGTTPISTPTTSAPRWAGLRARGSGLRASVHHVAYELDKRGWGPATLAFEGIEEVPVGAGGAKRTGDALEFVLVATGRADPAALGPDGPINIYA